MKHRFLSLAFVLLLFVGAFGGCAADKKEVADEKQVPVETLYSKATGQLDAGKYTDAARSFDDVDRQYPYSQWATRAQLMSGYAQYKNLKYDEAIIALDRFLELHPGDSNAAYALYLRALCYYEQISDVGRDQKMTAMALEGLRQVVQRYPDSQYARDASLKIDLTQDHLAGKEMEIGRYYLDRKQYQAALGRFQRVTRQYQTTTHVPEALHRMVEIYLALGMTEEATKAAALLGHNFPSNPWYRASYGLMQGKVPSLEESNKKGLFGRIFD